MARARVDGLKVLTLDGEADIRVGLLSALFSLRDVMRRAARDCPETTAGESTTGFSNVIPEALPCKCFDLIVGSGDGGWIAIMLGRLGMSTTQVIEIYIQIRKSIHDCYPYDGPVDVWQPDEKASAFEASLQVLVASRVESGVQEMLQVQNPSCYVLALAMHEENNAPHPALFRNYVARKDNLPNCPIWFAMRAVTSSTIFPPAHMSTTGQRFLAASQLNFNNPVNEAISEAISLAEDLGIAGPPLSCLVSLGAGHPGVETLNMSDLGKATTVLAEGAERAHQQALKRLAEVPTLSHASYFRVNVQQGFQKKLLRTITQGTILTHTASHLRTVEIDQCVEHIVDHILGLGDTNRQHRVFPTSSSQQQPLGRAHFRTPRIDETILMQTYIDELYKLNHGLPLWDPQPLMKVVEIGDVGILTKRGGFKTFFNITVPAESQPPRCRPPQDFEPFEFDPEEDITIMEDVIRESYISSGLQTHEIHEDNFHNLKLTWKLSKGAILILKDAPTEIAIPPNIALRNYVEKNYLTWYNHIQSPDGLKWIFGEHDELILVTGIYRNGDWSLGAWPHFDIDVRQETPMLAYTWPHLNPSSSFGSGCWSPPQFPGTRDGPSAHRQPKHPALHDPSAYQAGPQTLFVQGYRISRRHKPRDLPRLNDLIIPDFDAPALNLAESELSESPGSSTESAYLTAEEYDLPPPEQPNSSSEYLPGIGLFQDSDTNLMEDEDELAFWNWVRKAVRYGIPLFPLKGSAEPKDPPPPPPPPSMGAVSTKAAEETPTFQVEETPSSSAPKHPLDKLTEIMLKALPDAQAAIVHDHDLQQLRHLKLEDSSTDSNIKFHVSQVGQTALINLLPSATPTFATNDTSNTHIIPIYPEKALKTTQGPTGSSINEVNQAMSLENPSSPQQTPRTPKGPSGDLTEEVSQRPLSVKSPPPYWAHRISDGHQIVQEVLQFDDIPPVKHPSTLTSMHTLAQTYSDLDRHSDALNLKEQVVELRKRISGPEHPETLTSMNNLAQTYSYLGRHSDALNLIEQVVELRKRILGPEHPETLTSMNNLALTYSYLGRHSDALNLIEHVVELRKRISGPEHPFTLTSMDNLAQTYSYLGRHSDALNLIEQIVELRKRILGPEHPETLVSMNNLALTYSDLGRHSDALNLIEQIVELRKRILGPEHPETLTSMNNLALTYSDLGRHSDALNLIEQVVELRRRISGPEHPETLTSMNNLALTYSYLGRHSDALNLIEHVVELSKRISGPEHLSTLTSMDNLAQTYSHLGRHSDALNLKEHVVELRKRISGPEHPFTLTSMHSLARTYFDLGRHPEALDFMEQVLKLRKKVLGSEHPYTLSSQKWLNHFRT